MVPLRFRIRYAWAPMLLNKRVLATFTFIWTLAAAGMAAVALSATPEAGKLDDVQIGERGDQTRLALICTGACNVIKRDNDVFLLHGANADFKLDLSDRSKNISEFIAVSAGEGSLLRVTPVRTLEYANTKSCKVGGQAAICIDLFFYGDNNTSRAPASTARSTAAGGKKKKPVQQETTAAAEIARTPAKPALREGEPERLGRFARLTPPERLTPPPAILAKVQPIEQSIAVGKPAIRLQTPAAPAEKFNYAARVRSLLGKELTTAYCTEAQATLQNDPWALEAMVDVGLCAAARGDMTEAEEILSRLIEYTPDNYEAHVGRALIAAQAGEKSVARKYFQDALNALPPIEESNRIVQAMAAL